MRTSKVIKKFGTWAVTRYGVESLTHFYPIEKSRVNEKHNDGTYAWEDHMVQKNWVNMEDFTTAINYAREYFKPKKVKC